MARGARVEKTVKSVLQMHRVPVLCVASRENGNYYSTLFIGIMEKNMETTRVYWGYSQG